MWPYKELCSDMRREVLLADMFDFYRLVEIETHRVWSFSEGQDAPSPSDQTCHHIWGSEGPCANCTSRICIARNEGIMKIETLDEKVLYIYSTPVKIKSKPFALELIKDVTSSLMIPSMETRDNIQIIQMVDRFNELAALDSFTKLYNKNYTVNRIETLISKVADGETDHDRPPAIIMLDLDLFKEVNDEYGHTIGDEVLLFVAESLELFAGMQEGGWACRFGGDEFLVIAPNGIDAENLDRLERIIDKIQTHRFISDGKEFTVGVSYGIAYLADDDTPREAIDRADDSMYLMKKQHHATRG